MYMDLPYKINRCRVMLCGGRLNALVITPRAQVYKGSFNITDKLWYIRRWSEIANFQRSLYAKSSLPSDITDFRISNLHLPPKLFVKATIGCTLRKEEPITTVKVPYRNYLQQFFGAFSVGQPWSAGRAGGGWWHRDASGHAGRWATLVTPRPLGGCHLRGASYSACLLVFRAPVSPVLRLT